MIDHRELTEEGVAKDWSEECLALWQSFLHEGITLWLDYRGQIPTFELDRIDPGRPYLDRIGNQIF
jgi:hypothetical protein